MSSQERAKRFIEAFNRHDLDGIMSFYAPDVLHLHPFPEPLKGKEAVRKENEAFFKGFPDIRFEQSNLITSGDWSAVEFVMTGTHRGPLEGPTGTTPPTNKRIQLKGARFWRVNSQGLVSEEHYYFDLAAFMQQLGLKP